MGFTKRETMRAYFKKPENRLKIIYYAIRNRCYNPKHIGYKNYGAKGITMCDEWLNNPKSFYSWAFSNGFKYEPNKNGINTCTIDRIDGTKGYSPENCRWVSYEKQNTNRSDNIYLEYNGEKRTLNCWCKILNLPYPKMYYRIHFKKMTLEEAMKGINFTFPNKNTATNYKYIYKQKDYYIIQIKRKYYGRTKILDNAINLRNSTLKKMGILKQIQDIENNKGE